MAELLALSALSGCAAAGELSDEPETGRHGLPPAGGVLFAVALGVPMWGGILGAVFWGSIRSWL